MGSSQGEAEEGRGGDQQLPEEEGRSLRRVSDFRAYFIFKSIFIHKSPPGFSTLAQGLTSPCRRSTQQKPTGAGASSLHSSESENKQCCHAILPQFHEKSNK